MIDAGIEDQDSTHKFLFEHADIRGELAYLEKSYQHMLDIHQYTPAVATLLGEFLTAAVLLSTTIKFAGRLTLQAQGGGEIPLLMVECTDQLHVRGIVRGAEQGSVSIDCEFCNQCYLFTRAELADILDEPSQPALH